MPQIIGDIVMPSELIVPITISGATAGQPSLSGAIYISGATLCFRDAYGNLVRVTPI